MPFSLSDISIGDICELLTIIGFIYFLVKKFILKQVPIPASALGKVDRRKIEECVLLLEKKSKGPGSAYQMPEDLRQKLLADLHAPDLLKELLCDIAAHVGIDGSYINLQFQDDYTKEYAGTINTNGAWTTIHLQLHSFYTLDVITAVLSHEVMHLYLYYHGIGKQDTLENEILTDTAAVYFGYGEYLYRGYKVIETNLGLSYHKVGYIRPEDVAFIEEKIEKKRNNGSNL